jgi:hypothetical protein
MMQVIDEMHRKLGMAREQVDLAQARKEELWEKGERIRSLRLCVTPDAFSQPTTAYHRLAVDVCAH